MFVCPKLINRFDAISIKIPAGFFGVEIDKLILKFIWKGKVTRIAKTILKKNKIGGFILLDFKAHSNVTEIKIVQYWQKNRHRDQWNRIESPEADSHIYGQLMFDKDAKAIQWRKDNSFNKWCWSNWMSIRKHTRTVTHTLHPKQKLTQNES